MEIDPLILQDELWFLYHDNAMYKNRLSIELCTPQEWYVWSEDWDDNHRVYPKNERSMKYYLKKYS